ncbi:MAG: YciI family protein [Pacificimonas sp.]
MPHYAITCFDKPDSFDVRAETRPRHLAYAADLGERLILGGPFLDNEERPIGSLLICEFNDLSEAEAFAAGDPYKQAGLFESVTVMPWRQVFPDPT